MNSWSSKYYVPDLIEVEKKAMRYGTEEEVENLDDDEQPLCPYCNGSGEGLYDSSICGHCRGSGVERDLEGEEDAACSRADALNDAKRDES